LGRGQHSPLLAECGADSLFGLPGLLRLLTLSPLETFHRRQEAGRFWLAVYHDGRSFRSSLPTRVMTFHAAGAAREEQC
jgi:hypothetical protein